MAGVDVFTISHASIVDTGLGDGILVEYVIVDTEHSSFTSIK